MNSSITQPANGPGVGLSGIGLCHLLVVYLVWGSTYLAIRVAVREGAGFTPFWLGAVRVLLAGCLLLIWCACTGIRLRVTRRELGVLLTSGVLIWFIAHGLVVWAQQYAGSGYAAILFGSLPLWVAFLESSLDRRRCSLLLILALSSGLAGITVLVIPTLLAASAADALAVIALLLAPLTWGAGSIL